MYSWKHWAYIWACGTADSSINGDLTLFAQGRMVQNEKARCVLHWKALTTKNAGNAAGKWKIQCSTA